jgi:hypothetical protein
MVVILYTYGIAVGYSIIAREIFNISAYSPWNWGPVIGIITAGILWFLSGEPTTNNL